MPQEQPASSVHTSSAERHHEPHQPSGVGYLGYQPIMPAGSAPQQLPAAQPESAPLPAMMHLTRSPVRKPSRCNTGVTGMFNAYMSGDEFGVPSLYTPCDRYSSSVQVVSSQQHTPYHVHPMSCTSQGPAPQSSPMDLPGSYNQHYRRELNENVIKGNEAKKVYRKSKKMCPLQPARRRINTRFFRKDAPMSPKKALFT